MRRITSRPSSRNDLDNRVRHKPSLRALHLSSLAPLIINRDIRKLHGHPWSRGHSRRSTRYPRTRRPRSGGSLTADKPDANRLRSDVEAPVGFKMLKPGRHRVIPGGLADGQAQRLPSGTSRRNRCDHCIKINRLLHGASLPHQDAHLVAPLWCCACDVRPGGYPWLWGGVVARVGEPCSGASGSPFAAVDAQVGVHVQGPSLTLRRPPGRRWRRRGRRRLEHRPVRRLSRPRPATRRCCRRSRSPATGQGPPRGRERRRRRRRRGGPAASVPIAEVEPPARTVREHVTQHVQVDHQRLPASLGCGVGGSDQFGQDGSPSQARPVRASASSTPAAQASTPSFPSATRAAGPAACSKPRRTAPIAGGGSRQVPPRGFDVGSGRGHVRTVPYPRSPRQHAHTGCGWSTGVRGSTVIGPSSSPPVIGRKRRTCAVSRRRAG
jgi:hypothetical protein